MTENKIILPESPEAAQRVTETFWKSRNDRYYLLGDENVARWDGATHIHCGDCGEPTPKRRTVCAKCGAARDRECWRNLPKRPWDGVTPICIMGSDTYFFGEDDLEEYCEEYDVKPEDLLLVHCQPAKPRLLDVADLLEECLPEDGGGIPVNVLEAERVLNDAIQAMKPLVWYEDRVAVDLNMEAQK